MFGSRMTNAMVDCKKQQPQLITTTIGTLGGLIGEICWEKEEKELFRSWERNCIVCASSIEISGIFN